MSAGRRRAAGPLVFAVPGSLDQRTGGYRFGRRVVDGLRAEGRDVRVVELAGRFPDADAVARDAARRALDAAQGAECLVIDGLALPAFEGCLHGRTDGPALVGFIHHPLALETGLTPEAAARFDATERALWAALDGVVCASPHTARAVCGAGVPAERVAVAEPGVDLPPRMVAAREAAVVGVPARPVNLLCVATVTPRKGHLDLARALAALPRDRGADWRLDCVGSTERDSATASALRAAIDAYGLADRVTLHGEVSEAGLAAAWREADVFVLASHHEGYGMVLTEALAHGLPVIATAAGAIPETLPAGAGLLVPPGDPVALTQALDTLIGSPARRAALAGAARVARERLTDWPAAVRRWADAVERVGLRRAR